jgi:chemotaxis protein MotB
MAEGKNDQVKIVYERPRLPGHVGLFCSLSILLLAFFILLSAFSSFDDEKTKKALTSIEFQFRGIFEKTQRMFELFDRGSENLQVSEGPKRTPGDDLLFALMRSYYDDYRHLGEYVTDYGLGGNLGIIVTPEGLVITVGEEITFDAGSAVLTDIGKGFLDRLIRIVAPFRNDISIIGHTDASTPENRDFLSNWDLSQSRAISVMRYMADNGISINRLSAAGAGQYRPIAENNTPENQARNRRVEIIIKHPHLRKEGS